MKLTIPTPLKPGDRVAIVSPAGLVDQERIDAMTDMLITWGYEPYVAEHALGCFETYSGTAEERLQDLHRALDDPETKAIFCSRGGFGSMDLLKDLQPRDKWLVGFSDVTYLLGAFVQAGICCIHGPMGKHMMEGDELPTESQVSLHELLGGHDVTTFFPTSQLNVPGKVTAPLYGGNLSILQALIATSEDLLARGGILFIEDINEPVYKVQRVLTQMIRAGVFEKCQGLVVGNFLTTTPKGRVVFKEEIPKVVHELFEIYDIKIPIAFEAPIGHGDANVALAEGATYTLEVPATGLVKLQSHLYS